MAGLSVVRPAPPTALERLVDDFLASCRARGLSPATLERGYGHPLRRVFLPWCAARGVDQVEALNQRVLDRFTSSLLTDGGTLGRPLSRFSVHSYARTVRQFLAWCQKEGEEVKGQPQLPSLPRRVLDVLSRDELDQLELAAPTERDKLIIRLLADTGIRVGELCGLRAEDVHRHERRVFLRVRGKGAKERLVPLAPQLARRVERAVRARAAAATTSDRLFLALRRRPGGDYEALTTSGVLQLLRGAAQRAGITKRVHPHLLRHSFATEAMRRGMNPVQLSQILGHNSLRMIERTYTHLTVSDAYDAMIKLLVAE
jgi:integrase/recombinase XerD